MASTRSSSNPNFTLASSQTLQHAATVGIAVIAVAARSYACLRTHFTSEQALAALRYADNLAAGRGFVDKTGEHVLRVSGPLYAMLLSIVSTSGISMAHLNPVLIGKACNITAEGVTCYLLARLMARNELGRPIEGLFAASLYALSPAPIIASISGAETGLVTCVGLAMVYAYVARRPYWLYILGAVLFLLRIDGLLLFAILAAALAITERKLPLKPGAIALIITIPWMLFATLFLGSPVPNSSIGSRTVDGLTSAVPVIHDAAPAGIQTLAAQFVAGWTQCMLTVLFMLGAILVVSQALRHAERGVMAAPLIWCMIYYSVMFVSPIAASNWPLVAPLPVFMVIACLAGATAPIKLGKMRPDLAANWSGRAVPGALAVLILFGIGHLRSVIHETRVSQRLQGTAPGKPSMASASPLYVAIQYAWKDISLVDSH